MNDVNSRWTLNVLFIDGERIEIRDITREAGETAVQAIHHAMRTMPGAIIVGEVATMSSSSIRAAYLSQVPPDAQRPIARHQLVADSGSLISLQHEDRPLHQGNSTGVVP